MRGAASIAGLLVVAAHAVLFVAVVPTCNRAELVLDVAPGLSVGPLPSGTVPAGLDAAHELLGVPGLQHARYTVSYQGGFTRSVGVSGLVGPFQDPAKPECSGRVVVGQALLDDGKASPGTIAAELAKTIAAEMKDESVAALGKFEKVTDVHLQWAQIAAHSEDWALVEDGAPNGYVRASLRLDFENIDVPLTLALIPEPSAAKLSFRVVAKAKLDFGNRALQWVSDNLGGNKLATRLARREIDSALITVLAPPPPFSLGDGHTLTFGYCDGPPQIIDNHSGAIPFSISITKVDRDPRVLPPRHGLTPYAPLTTGTVAIDLDLDGLNALLFELWRTGFLDKALASAGLDNRFNTDPLVTEFLSLRISSPVLALPPVLGPAGKHRLAMYADARVTVADGDLHTTGRIWTGLALDFAALARTGKPDLGVDLAALELSCERTPTRLAPCYADLVNAMRDRSADFHGELTRVFTKLLGDIFIDQRVGASGLSADLVIKGVTPTVFSTPDNASLHLELDSVIDPKP